MRRTVVLATALLTALALALPAGAGAREKSSMHSFETEQPIDGFTTLKRNSDSLDVGVHLRELTPGNAETLWAVVFNEPGECSDDICGEDDIFIGGDPSNGPNFDQIMKAQISVFWSGFGGVANGGGNLNGNVTIEVGDFPGVGEGQILFGPGLLSSQAEIHFVVQDHGEYDNDPLQITTFEGGCNPDCVDIQFSIHK